MLLINTHFKPKAYRKRDTSDKDFDEKIKEQLKDASDDVIDLMANIIWLWRLPPIKADRESSVDIFKKNQ